MKNYIESVGLDFLIDGELVVSSLYEEVTSTNAIYKDKEYMDCVKDLLDNDEVKAMKYFKHHKKTSCYDHSLSVSYKSYLICKNMGLDYRSAARGGMLHDIFLYDWHISKPRKGLHAFVHPFVALENASKLFDLNKKEKDIIKKHMWPLCFGIPKYWESIVVSSMDKYCAIIEVCSYRKSKDNLLAMKKLKFDY